MKPTSTQQPQNGRRLSMPAFMAGGEMARYANFNRIAFEKALGKYQFFVAPMTVVGPELAAKINLCVQEMNTVPLPNVKKVSCILALFLLLLVAGLIILMIYVSAYFLLILLVVLIMGACCLTPDVYYKSYKEHIVRIVSTHANFIQVYVLFKVRYFSLNWDGIYFICTIEPNVSSQYFASWGFAATSASPLANAGGFPGYPMPAYANPAETANLNPVGLPFTPPIIPSREPFGQPASPSPFQPYADPETPMVVPSYVVPSQPPQNLPDQPLTPAPSGLPRTFYPKAELDPYKSPDESIHPYSQSPNTTVINPYPNSSVLQKPNALANQNSTMIPPSSANVSQTPSLVIRPVDYPNTSFLPGASSTMKQSAADSLTPSGMPRGFKNENYYEYKERGNMGASVNDIKENLKKIEEEPVVQNELDQTDAFLIGNKEEEKK